MPDPGPGQLFCAPAQQPRPGRTALLSTGLLSTGLLSTGLLSTKLLSTKLLSTKLTCAQP